jgi:hypothetical protein
MGGIAGSIGNLFGGGNIGSDISGLGNISGTLGGMGSTLFGEGQQIYGPAYNQFAAGAAGQLTPSQQAAVNQTLSQMNLGTQGAYSNLGLGGSTMEQQDLGANQLASLAQQNAFTMQSETEGLNALSQALGFGQQGIGGEAQAGTALANAGRLGVSQEQAQLGALEQAAGSLGGKGAGGGLGSDIGSIFGLGGGSTNPFLGLTPTASSLSTAASDFAANPAQFLL